MSFLTSRSLPLSRETPRVAAFLASPLTTLLLIAAAIALQAAGHIDCDVSWFITFAEKVVDGAVPYVDVTDPNPPAAFLVLAPAVRLARALGLAVEPVVAALVFFAGFLSLTFSAAAIVRYGAPRSREDRGLLLNASVFLLLVAPAHVFAEREHMALLALMPLLAMLAARAEGGRAPMPLRLLAGLGGGLAVCFKPFFALAILLPALALAARERSPRLLLSGETAAAAALVLLYGALTLVFFPAYARDALPLIADVYQPARESWARLALSLAPFNVALLVALAAASAQGFAHPPAAPGFVAPAAARVCAFASLGFLAAFLLQGKGWMNHAYPGLALALLAWCFFALDPHPRARAARDGRLFKFVFLPLFLSAPAMFGAGAMLGDFEEHPGLDAGIARVAPAHPRLIALARELSFGHPVTRQLGGTWVGRPNALWLASLAGYLLPGAKDPAWRARLEGYRRRDLAGFAEDVRAGRPDAIIVEDRATREWTLAQPETTHALDGYEKTGQVEEVEIWTRKAP
ncbi:hypothetical protein WOC76_07215 [Methylocystis sp. IM3]